MAKNGFTLIELSIVLVIIGLIVGGVLVGRDLIEAAQQRKVISEVEQFRTASMTFQTKYNGLPGNIANASQFWPIAGDCPNRLSLITPDGQTCNGSGNGQWASGALNGDGTNNLDRFRVPQQLALAHLIPSQYTGTCYTGNVGDDCVPQSASYKVGVNAPPAATGGDGNYIFQNMDTWPYVPGGGYETYKWPGSSGNVIGIAGTINEWPGISAVAAGAIDRKIDDGKPATGQIRDLLASSSPYDMALCHASAASYTNNTAAVCVLFFNAGF